MTSIRVGPHRKGRALHAGYMYAFPEHIATIIAIRDVICLYAPEFDAVDIYSQDITRKRKLPPSFPPKARLIYALVSVLGFPGLKSCLACGKLKAIESYELKRTCRDTKTPKPWSTDGRRGVCYDCSTEVNHRAANQPAAFWNDTFNNCKTRDKRRITQGRYAAVTGPYVSPKSLEELFVSQNGRCALLGVPITSVRRSEWQASLERIDQNKGYAQINVMWIALEAQNQLQWTKGILLELLRRIALPDAEAPWDERGLGKRATVRGRINALLAAARSMTERRNQSHKRVKTTMEIDFDFVAATIGKQQNRCYYSSALLDWSEQASHFAASPERLNTNVGYTPANVVVICKMFQALDFSARPAAAERSGCAAWTREKVATMLASIKALYAVEPSTPGASASHAGVIHSHIAVPTN